MSKKTFDDLMNSKDLDELLTRTKKNPEGTESILKEKQSSDRDENVNVASFLANWTSKHCKPERMRLIAQKIGYNDAPFFFAKNKKAKLVSEILIANTAIAIFSTNQSVNPDRAKIIIDAFLDTSRETMFLPMEKINPSFKLNYENRISKYFSFLQSANLSDMGDSFINELGASPSTNGRHFIVMEFSGAIKEISEEIKRTITYPWVSSPTSQY